MPDLIALARAVVPENKTDADAAFGLPEIEFVEAVTYASADEIVNMLQVLIQEDWMGLPPWARGLAHRIACLQRPGDAALLRAAAHDRSAFYPDGDGITASLLSEADRLDRGGPGA
ncbi:hypothetical protein AB0451_16255 [Streptomyces sp. NPDC052000]|uniref:hypothetical protein n=1 Tax=Streptomyces sp. NPDC052000 TaxID=3155676 RepID=UPI0034507649